MPAECPGGALGWVTGPILCCPCVCGTQQGQTCFMAVGGGGGVGGVGEGGGFCLRFMLCGKARAHLLAGNRPYLRLRSAGADARMRYLGSRQPLTPEASHKVIMPRWSEAIPGGVGFEASGDLRRSVEHR
jgi:hypothetical protein